MGSGRGYVAIHLGKGHDIVLVLIISGRCMYWCKSAGYEETEDLLKHIGEKSSTAPSAVVVSCLSNRRTDNGEAVVTTGVAANNMNAWRSSIFCGPSPDINYVLSPMSFSHHGQRTCLSVTVGKHKARHRQQLQSK